MKTLQLAAAVLAVGALALPSGAETVTTNDWWDVDFTSPTPAVSVDGHDYGGTTLREGELGPLTNNASLPGFDPAVLGNQPWASGHWEMEEGDESYWTNDWYEVDVQGTPGLAFTNSYLKLDTQGNDLTWRPTNNNGVIKDVATLVDADLYLVGSDSPPDASDFDAKSDVQTAIYLKNELFGDDHPQAGETSNSVLCVYAWDPLANNNAGANYWQELKGVELEDNAWAHVQVVVDHSVSPAKISVYVNGTRMSARDGTAVDWPVANRGSLPEESSSRVRSVAFRGTGAVDNFVGKTMKTSFEQAYFKAEVYLNDVITNELCQVTDEKLNIGGDTKAEFTGFMFDDKSRGHPATYSLTSIVISDFVNNSETTYTYTYDVSERAVTPSVDTPDIHFEEDEDEGEVYQTGEFSVKALTTGATLGADPDEPVTVVRIYFETLPEEGTHYAQATTTIGGTTTTDSKKVRPSEFDGGATKTITWTFPAEKNGNVLSTIQLYNGATLEYADKTATVTVTTNAALQADTLFAAAVYGTGSLAEGQDLRYTEQNGLYTFEAYVPPVAIRVSADGTTTNECGSLREAIENYAQAGDTIYLVADDRVSFSATETEIVIDKALTIDGGSNTLYGVTDYAYDGHNDHDLFIASSAGDVTIKNLTFSEFSDTAPTVQYRTYPIWTSQAYAGTLTLDGVTVEKFARTAINLGNGNFVITNCAIKGYAGEAGAPTRYFQNAITVKDAKGTVADTTATGIGSTAEPWGAGLVTFNSDGAGEIKFVSGSYTADYLIEVSSNATGKAVFEGGTFIATGEEASAFQLDEGEDATFYVNVTGGWFDRKPEAAVTVVRNPYAAVQDAANAPDPAATWTVGTFYTITFNHEDDTLILATNVLAGTTGYGPAEDPDPVDGRIGVQFIGWTNKVDGGAVVRTANLPAADGDATWTAAFGPLVLQHVGAKSEEGFIILDPGDTAADDKQVEFTAFNPAAGAGTATATISAAMLNPNGATSVTLQLIYRTTLTGADQYVDAVVSNIDTTAGTATVTFTLPNADTLFLIGFTNQTGVND